MKEPHLVSKPHSAPHTKSIESHMIVAGTANLKLCVYEFPPKYLYMNFIKIGRWHEIGQSVTRPCYL